MNCQRIGCGHTPDEHLNSSGPCNVKHADGTHCICYRFQSIPQAVIDSIHTRFEYEDAERILSELRYSSLNGCWFFNYAGMLCGVEPDGYIHT